MAVQDLWYKTQDGKKVPAARHGRGKRWRVNWEDPETGRGCTEAFDLKEAAKNFDAKVRTTLGEGTFVDPDRGKMRIRDLVAEWQAMQLHGETSVVTINRMFRIQVLPFIGDLELRRTRLFHIQKWVKDLSEDYSPTTVRLTFGWVKTIFKYAVDDRKIGRNPCESVKLPDSVRRIKDIPSSETVRALVEGYPPEYKATVLLAAGCGLRAGEIFGLEPSCIDLGRGIVSVQQQVKQIVGEPSFIGTPKTRTSYRDVSMPRIVAEALKGISGTRYRMWDKTDPRKPVERDVSLLFVSPRAKKPFTTGTWDGLIDRHSDGLGYHILRHYFATMLIGKGASVKQVQLALGHANPTVTLDTYTGYWPDTDVDSSAVIDAELF